TDDGWIELNDLIDFFKDKKQVQVTIQDIQHVSDTSEKKRFEIENGRLRAVQGHSLPVEIEMQKITKVLRKIYHGTFVKNVDSIRKHGLKRMSRNFIHLTDNFDHLRNNSTVLIEIDVESAMSEGIDFFKAKNGVILTKGIDGILPQKYLKTFIT